MLFIFLYLIRFYSLLIINRFLINYFHYLSAFIIYQLFIHYCFMINFYYYFPLSIEYFLIQQDECIFIQNKK